MQRPMLTDVEEATGLTLLRDPRPAERGVSDMAALVIGPEPLQGQTVGGRSLDGGGGKQRENEQW